MLVDDAPRRIVSHVYNLLAASGFRPARLSIACLLFRFTPAIRGSASRRRPCRAQHRTCSIPAHPAPVFLQRPACVCAHPRRLFRPSGFGRRNPCACNHSPSFTYAPRTPVRFHTPPSPRARRAFSRPGLRAGRKAPGPAALLLSCAVPRRPIPAGLCGPLLCKNKQKFKPGRRPHHSADVVQNRL